MEPIGEENLTSHPTSRAEKTLRVATDLFLEHGYAKVSIDAIVARVGGSKRDLYAEFGGKEGLFRRVITGVCQEVMHPLEALPSNGDSAESALTAFGTTFLGFLLTPRVVALQKLVMSEANRYPEFAQTFIERGCQSAYRVAAELLVSLANQGEVKVESPRVVGALFCDMLVADLQFRTVAGEVIEEQEIDERVRLGVATVLYGIAKE
jgi:AcrR family transcriptional regulator